MRPAALLLLACAGLTAQTASVEGTVVNETSGQALAGAHVRIFTIRFNGPGDTLFGAYTGRDGRFAISCAKPGSYVVLPELAGFVPSGVKDSPIPLPGLSVKAGDRLTGLKFSMIPRAVIKGRVLDAYGDPVQGATIRVPAATKGAATFFGIFGDQFNVTDDRGEFRVSGLPGEYYVTARTGDVESFYPTGTLRERAKAIRVDPGQDATGIEIRVGGDQLKSLSIGGTVSGIPPGDARVFVHLQWRQSSDMFNMLTSQMAGPDGRFTFSAQTPRTYRIWATSGSGSGLLVSQVQEFELSQSAVSGLHLALGAATEVSGALTLESGIAPPKKITLESIGGGGRYGSGDVAPDGTFRIAGLQPGYYSVKVDPMSEGSYLKEVSLDGAPVQPDMIDLFRTPAKSALKVAIGRGAIKVSGVVRDTSGAPLTDRILIVFLMRDPKHLRSGDSVRIKEDAKYEFTARPPGKYRLFAIDPLTSKIQSDTELKEMAATLPEIELKTGENIVKDLPVTVKGGANAPAQ